MIQRRGAIQREATNEETSREEGDPTMKRRVVKRGDPTTKTHGGCVH